MEQVDYLALAKKTLEWYEDPNHYYFKGHCFADSDGKEIQFRGVSDDLKFAYRDRTVRACVLGAFYVSSLVDIHHADQKFIDGFGKFLGFDNAYGLTQWNDRVSKGKEDNIALLRRVIARYESPKELPKRVKVLDRELEPA